jgi:transitional endoplasmic reticulum ATPase
MSKLMHQPSCDDRAARCHAQERKLPRSYSWEWTQVNKFLAAMDTHTGSVAATTNRIDRLDPACLHRFDLKIQLSPLKPPQAALAFAYFFNLEAPSGLAGLEGLTCGDFAVVQRRTEFLGGTADAVAQCGMLGEELTLRDGLPRRLAMSDRRNRR